MSSLLRRYCLRRYCLISSRARSFEARGAQSKSYLRQFQPAQLPRDNGQLARPTSVGRCADRREIPWSRCASSAELIWTVLDSALYRSCTYRSKIAGWPDQPDLLVGRPTVLKEVSPSISTPRLA